MTTISAGSHFEAMAAYYRLVGWGEYTTDQPQDYQPYPQEWILEQAPYRALQQTGRANRASSCFGVGAA